MSVRMESQVNFIELYEKTFQGLADRIADWIRQYPELDSEKRILNMLVYYDTFYATWTVQLCYKK
jgi:hypothetical protein